MSMLLLSNSISFIHFSKIFSIKMNIYLANNLDFRQYYTTTEYIVITSDGYTVPAACFNPTLLQSLNGLCDSPNVYVSQVLSSSTPSFIDLRGNYLQADLNQDNFANIITTALQRSGYSVTGRRSK